MRAEILMIGTELLLGQIIDTNAAHIAQVLKEHGVNIFQKTTVGDNRERIIGALDAALSRCDVVLCSGGLGPTEDDITRECIGELLGRPLAFRADLYESILERFKHSRIQIPENNKKQATLPKGAVAIENPLGTAPGVLVEDPRGIIICMPGVPFELKAMLDTFVIPYLTNRFGLQGILHYRVLKICGMGESAVDAKIGDLITSSTNPTVGLLASPDVVRIRIAARADSHEAAEALITPVEAVIERRLPGMILGKDDDTLEGIVDQLLTERGWKLAIVETLSGGTLCQRLTAARAGCLAGGRVLPLDRLPGLPSPETGIDLASGAMVEFGTACGLALVADSQARQTHVAFVTPDGRHTWSVGHFGSRERDQVRTSVYALERVRRQLAGIPAGA